MWCNESGITAGDSRLFFFFIMIVAYLLLLFLPEGEGKIVKIDIEMHVFKLI